MKALKDLSKFKMKKENIKKIMGGSEYPPGVIVIGGLPYCIQPVEQEQEQEYIPFHSDCMCTHPCPL